MKNKLVDLNNHLFAQLERLGEEGLTPEQLEQEARRSEAMVSISTQILKNADLGLQAAKLVAEYGGNYEKLLPMIEGTKA
jgi:transposase-like protein